MVAKDQEAADALIQLKVQDYSAPVMYKAMRNDLAKLRTFHTEYDIGTVEQHFLKHNDVGSCIQDSASMSSDNKEVPWYLVCSFSLFY